MSRISRSAAPLETIDVFARVIPVFDDGSVDVALIDDDWRDQNRWNVFLAVVDLVFRIEDLLFREHDRRIDRAERERLTRFVDRHRLRSFDDPLRGVPLRILSGDKNFAGEA